MSLDDGGFVLEQICTNARCGVLIHPDLDVSPTSYVFDGGISYVRIGLGAPCR